MSLSVGVSVGVSISVVVSLSLAISLSVTLSMAVSDRISVVSLSYPCLWGLRCVAWCCAQSGKGNAALHCTALRLVWPNAPMLTFAASPSNRRRSRAQSFAALAAPLPPAFVYCPSIQGLWNIVKLYIHRAHSTQPRTAAAHCVTCKAQPHSAALYHAPAAARRTRAQSSPAQPSRSRPRLLPNATPGWGF